MLIPNICTHNQGYNKFGQNKLHINISECIMPTPAVCVCTMCCGLRKLYLVSAEIGNQRNAGTRLHMHLLWMKNFTLKALAFPDSPTCLSVSVSFQAWLGFPSWHKCTQKPFHGRTTKVSHRERFPQKNAVKLGKLHIRGWHSHIAFCNEQLLCMRLFLFQTVKFWRS